jgi:ligand-binding sensor domain-containing protein
MVMSLAVSGSSVFAGTDGGVFLSTNSGTGWTAVNSGLPENTGFSCLAVDGSNIFAGTVYDGAFRSTNSGTNWIAVNSGLPENTNVMSLAASGSNIFAGTPYAIFLSTNNGTIWTKVDSTITDVMSLVVSGNSIFAETSTGVLLSTNNGTSWTAVDSGLTDHYVQCLAVSGNNIFAGTDYGIFLSTNSGTTWTEADSGLMITNVTSLVVSGSNIFAATWGGGVWSRPLSEMIGAVNPFSKGITLHQGNFGIHSPSRTNPNATIEFSLSHSDQVSVKVYDLSGREMTTLVNRNLGAGSYSYSWDTRNMATGCYLARMQAGSNACVRSIPIFR